jgi:dihydroneopterin aldolase
VSASSGASGGHPDGLEVRGLRLWAHVGVLPEEREHGQWFELVVRLAADLSAAARGDDLAASHDYAVGIAALQEQARTIRCLTLEHYGERILDRLEEIYGPVAMRIELTKCRPPVAGFTGTATLHRSRRWP